MSNGHYRKFQVKNKFCLQHFNYFYCEVDCRNGFACHIEPDDARETATPVKSYGLSLLILIYNSSIFFVSLTAFTKST